MKRITVSLPDELVRLVDQERRRRDVSAAAVIRDAVEALFAPAVHTSQKRYSFIGIGASDSDDGFTAARIREFYERDIPKIARDSGLYWPDDPLPISDEDSNTAESSSPDLVHARNT